jgi:hypothetical protein
VKRRLRAFARVDLKAFMRAPGYLILIAGLLFVGCSKQDVAQSKATNSAASSGNPLTAPVDYLGAVAKAQKSSIKAIDTAYINQAVQFFNASEGRYPKDLNELITEKYLPKLPDLPAGMKFEYNSASGQVRVVPR